METHKVPSVSHAVTFYIHAGEQQGFSTHNTGAFKTVAAIGHAAESAMFGTATTAGRFESGVGHIVINEVFHLRDPWSVAHDAVPAVRDCVLFRPLVYLSVGDVGAGVLFLVYVAFCRTNSLRYPPILLIYHVPVQPIAGT